MLAPEVERQELLLHVVALGPDRLSLFGYAHLPKMRPLQASIDPATLPDPETRAYLYAESIELLTSNGYERIGMDHFARPEDALSVAQREGRLHRNFQGYTVQDDGAIAIPDVGRIVLGGLTLEEAEDAVFRSLVEARLDPSFSIEVAEFKRCRGK